MQLKSIATDILFSKISLGDFAFPFSVFDLLLRFLLPSVIIFIVFKLIKRAVFHLIRKSNIQQKSKDRSILWIRRIFNASFLVIVVSLAANLFGAETLKYLGIFINILNQPLIESGSTKITFLTLIMTIPVFYIASWAGKASRKMINTSFLDRIGFDASRKFSVISILQYSVMVVVALTGFSVIGIDLSAITVIFGVLGLGLGFGLQNTVANFMAGIQIIFTRPVKEGDRILINGLEGTVSQIKLSTTVINTLTNESIIIPNSKLVQNEVHNYSYEDRRILVKNFVQISYDTNPEKALKILHEIGKDNPWAIKNMEPIPRFRSFGDSGLDLGLFTWIDDVMYKYDAEDWTNREIWKRFDEQKISIPFPHVQLKVSEPIQFTQTSEPVKAPGKTETPPFSPEDSEV